MYKRRYFDLAYQTADKQERYQLDGYELFTNSALDLRGAQWKVTLGEHDLLSAKRRRGAQGTGSYIFERVHKGAQTVTWAQDFGLDIEEIRERSEPPWI